MIQIPKPEMVKINLLKSDNQNPNKMSDRQLEALKQNIEKFGFIIPIITNKDYVIADGEQRLFVATTMGMDEVPVIRLDISEVDRKILRQVLNKLKGEHDEALDYQEYLRIMESDKELEELKRLTALSDRDVNFILDKFRQVQEDEFDVDKSLSKPKYDVKTGDIWQLGRHRLVCGDSTLKEDVQKLMSDEKADMVFTDPPYNVNYSSKNELLNLYDKGKRIQDEIVIDNFISSEEYIKFCEKWFKNMCDFLKIPNFVYICGNYETLIGFRSFHNLFKISNLLVWAKNSLVLGRMDYKCQHEFILYGWLSLHKWYGENNETTLWKVDKPLHNKLHPTMKPIELMERAIKNSSKKDDIILDLFGGSGSTLIACEQMGRICYMMEIDPKYCSVILERWESFTNKKAVKLNG